MHGSSRAGSAGLEPGGGEWALVERLRERFSACVPDAGEVWIGDDAAVVCCPGAHLLLAIDVVTEGVHFDLDLTGLSDAGWKAVAVNVSDIAAMGGRPLHVVCGLVAPAGTNLDLLMDGLSEAAAAYDVTLVGGDLSAGCQLVVSVAITGTTDGRSPVLRSGARAGDALLLTGPLGASAAGLTRLRERPPRDDASAALEQAYRRPQARVREGLEAAACGATAMIDISDGLSRDLDHIARQSGVGIRLDYVPVARGATAAEALGGGEDYELVFALPPDGVVPAAERFKTAGLRAPLRIGECVTDPEERSLAGAELEILGWEHELS